MLNLFINAKRGVYMKKILVLLTAMLILLFSCDQITEDISKNTNNTNQENNNGEVNNNGNQNQGNNEDKQKSGIISSGRKSVRST